MGTFDSVVCKRLHTASCFVRVSFHCTRVLLFHVSQSYLVGGRKKRKRTKTKISLILSGSKEVKHMSPTNLNFYLPGIHNYVI